MEKLKILVLCDYGGYNNNANTIWDHFTAFGKYSQHQVTIVSTRYDLPKTLDLNWFDVLVLHYSVKPLYFLHQIKERISGFSGLKVLFVQDEYQRIFDLNKEIAQLKIDILFSCLTEDLYPSVYPRHALPGLSIYHVLTGYVPERLLSQKHIPMSKRPIDLFYRGRDLGFWFGKRAREKSEIVKLVEPHLKAAGLNYDLASREHERIYGDQWIERLKRSKATLGVESGVSVFDFTGEIEKNVREYVQKRPEATFEAVKNRFFSEIDGLLDIAVISPRCFEAAALKTAMILLEGHYSGLLEPERHYIPLKKDGSNIGDVIAKLRDVAGLTRMVETAYHEVALSKSNSYKSSIERFDQICSSEFARRKKVLRTQSTDAISAFFAEPTCVELSYDDVPIYFAKEIVKSDPKIKIAGGEVVVKKNLLRMIFLKLIGLINSMPAGPRSLIKRVVNRLRVIIGYVSDSIK